MRFLQILNIGVGLECNVKHDDCPIWVPDRFKLLDTSKPLDDDLIVETVVSAYEKFGFRGAIGWMDYSEPLLYVGRITSLMDRIDARFPDACYVLMTNGKLLVETDCGFLSRFSVISVTNYGFVSYQSVMSLRRKLGLNIKMNSATHDRRLEKTDIEPSRVRCKRMLYSLPVDYYGNVRICCIDWKGESPLGNLRDVPLAELVRRYQRVRASVVRGIRDDAPTACKSCPKRLHLTFVPCLVPYICEDARLALRKRTL